MQIKHIMNEDVIMVEVSTTMKEAFVLMQKYQARIFPVVDKDTKLVGVVTLRDFLQSFYPKYDELADSLPDMEALENKVSEVREAPVKDLMHKDYPTITPYDTVLHAGSMMLMRNISWLPVLDPANHVVGVISQSVIIEELMKQSILGSEMEIKTNYIEQPKQNAPKLKGFGFEEPEKEKYPERRIHPRFNLKANASFEYADPKQAPAGFLGSYDVRMIDISAGGARFEVNKKIDVGTLIHLQFDLPIQHGKIDSVARVVRWSKNEENDLFDVGVMFLALTTDERQSIDSYGRRLPFSSHLPDYMKKGPFKDQKSWLLFN